MLFDLNQERNTYVSEPLYIYSPIIWALWSKHVGLCNSMIYIISRAFRNGFPLTTQIYIVRFLNISDSLIQYQKVAHFYFKRYDKIDKLDLLNISIWILYSYSSIFSKASARLLVMWRNHFLWNALCTGISS